MTGDTLPQLDFKLLDIIFFFTRGHLEVQSLGFGIQEQQ